MDELKLRAGEKLEALHVAAKTAADSSRNKVEDVYTQTAEAIRRLRDAFNEIWQHELIAESRARVVAFTRDTIQRIKEGAPPLSPVLLYEELKALFKDRVWRRSVFIFVCGAACGCACGLALGLRAYSRAPTGPHARALHSHTDSVMMVEDATALVAGSDDVLIRVQAFSVCPRDRGVLRGHAGVLRSLLGRTELTVGRGFAGVVLDVGRNVSDLELGDEVWGVVSEWSGGAASELLTIRSTRISKRPLGLSANDAASLPFAGTLALRAIDQLQLDDTRTHTRVAVCGAASGEGCLITQLLSSAGVHLTVMAPRHTLATLHELGAQDTLELGCANATVHQPSWADVEAVAGKTGPWDRLVACSGHGTPHGKPYNKAALLKSTAPRNAVVDVRPSALISDRLPPPFSLVFAATFYTFRALRWVLGRGSHTDWLESKYTLRDGLTSLATLVDEGQLAPVLDKVYLPQDFESALAHACSEDAIGTTVIRFP